ncbi:hypothetical protein HHL11_19935 [Ramlibacter sp. G-1-2-2]|uniref:Uncharacterized protein n=1 Tax=Ramlibacter agri TaxID=2728837 RepID=A0A848H945_9BURK|nr:hypothetical protein [Ramlibacter agri]NML46029.1 hypothetical protein [Ramlibacter agri]
MGKEELDLLPTLAEGSPPMQAERVPPELDEDASALGKIKAADAAREGFPGEHWVALGLGILAWQLTRKDPRWYVRAAGGFAATTLVARAAAGREGLSKVLRWTPLGKGISNCPPCAPGSQRS